MRDWLLSHLPGDLKLQLHHWKYRRTYMEERAGEGQYSMAAFDELRCIFVHIPKSGGVSVNRALFGSLGGGHGTVGDYKRLFGPLTYRRYFSFTIVRNPYARLVSAYTFLRKGGFDPQDAEWAEEHLAGFKSFPEFVASWLTEEAIWSKSHFFPQHHFVCDGGRTPSVDYVGRLETIDSDFRYVCERLGVSRVLGHDNPTGRREPLSSFYDSQTMERVAQVYREDFDIFGYSTEALP